MEQEILEIEEDKQDNYKQPDQDDQQKPGVVKQGNKILDDDDDVGIQKNEPATRQSHAAVVENKAFAMIKQTKETVLADDLVELSSTWSSLHPQFSQTKPLPFSQGQKATEFWQSQIANDAQDLFKVLLPKKIVLGICNQLNSQLKKQFSGSIDEKQLKKKLYKADQLYEYFGVKILMGYCRMPDPEDYFNQSLPFRNRIGELIKEGRFKCVESWTSFTDEMLLCLKQQQKQTKSEYKEHHSLNEEEVIPYIMKKVNKIQRKACNVNQMLSVVRNQYFEAIDVRSSIPIIIIIKDEPISCIYLQDVNTNFIVSMTFQQQNYQDVCLMKMLDKNKQRNHKVYVQRNMLSLEQINHLALCSGIYCHGISKNPPQNEIKFSKGELMANGTLMVLMLKQKDPTNVLVSSADGFHRYSATDKRSYATVTLQDIMKKSEQYAQLSDQYKCQFSCISLSGALLTEVLEMITWNSYIAFKNILKKNQTIEFLDFRLMLAKQLLASKIKILEQNALPTLPLHHPKTNTIAIQTEKLSSYSSFQPKAPISSFHIPTMLVAPTSFQITLQCVVCRKVHTQLTQCANCSEVSGKLVSLCPTECFSMFHQAPTEYISNADDIPSLPLSQKAQQQQFEASSLAQSSTYTQSLQNRYPPSQQPSQNKYQNYQPPPGQNPNQRPPPPSVDDYNQQPAEDDLWDDGQMRRRPGRPVGARNRRQINPDDPTRRGPSEGPNQNSAYNIQDESRVPKSNNQKQISYSYVLPQDQQ